MNFLNPIFLFGLAASALPIIIHLLNLRKQKKIEFSTLKFLNELQQTKIRRLKLKQWLLLLLRTLLIIFIVLAFARPAIENSIPGFVTYSKSSTAVIIDNTFSMELSDNLGQRFRRAQSITKQITENLDEGDKVAISVLSSDKIPVFKSSIGEVDDDISSLEINTKKVFFQSSLNRSKQSLIDDNNLNKNILLISDLQSNLLNEVDTMSKLEDVSSISIIQIGDDQNNINNVSIDSVRLLSTLFRVGMDVELEINIQNHGTEALNDIVMSLIINDERISQRTIDLDPKSSQKVKLFSAVNLTGVIDARIEIEGDALDRDNRYYFSFIIPEKASVALFSNKKKSFSEIALSNEVSDLSSLDVFDSKELEKISLESYDVIVLSSIKISKSAVKLIASFIKNGGNVLLLPNEESLNEIDQLMNQISGAGIKGQFYQDSEAEFTEVEKLHPIFDGVFSGSSDRKSIVESPKISKAYYSLSGFPIIKVGNYNFLSEIDYENGKMIYCAVSADLSWSDLPLKGIFPVILNSAVSYLSSSDNYYESIIGGERKRIIINKKDAADRNFKIIDPNGVEMFVEGAELPSGVLIELTNTSIPGNYVIFNSNGSSIAAFSSNHDPHESELNINSSEWLERLKNIVSNNVPISVYKESDQLDKDVLKEKAGTELWQLFVLLAIITALAEMFVQRIYKNDLNQ